jgi:hypothetical protein
VETEQAVLLWLMLFPAAILIASNDKDSRKYARWILLLMASAFLMMFFTLKI